MKQAILKLALAVFVIVTLSAFGGVIRGGKVAQDGLSQVAAAAMIPGILQEGTELSVFGSTSVKITEEGDRLVYYPNSGQYFIWEQATGEADGPYVATDQWIIDTKYTLNYEYDGEVPSCDVADPSCALNPLFTTTVNAEKAADETKKAEEKKEAGETKEVEGKVVPAATKKAVVPPAVEEVSNRCSTTYVVSDAVGNSVTTDCYNKGEDKASKAIKSLAKCIADNTKGVKPGSSDAVRVYESILPELEGGMCKGEAAKVVKTPVGSTAILREKPFVIYPIVTPPIPSACKKQYDVVIGMMGGLNGDAAARRSASSANVKDIGVCTWKGAVACFSSGTPGSETLTCKKKSDGALEKLKLSGVPVMVVPSSPTSCSGNAAKKVQCYVQGIFKNPKTKGSVVKGFLSGLKNVFSKKKGTSSNIPEPQCLIEANKSRIKEGESVSVRWKTDNATSVSIEGIADSVSKTGLEVLSPTQTTTYKLIAIGGGDKRKECQTTVEVTKANDGPRGQHPPTLSCTPDLIEKEEPALIEWACPAEADSSEGTGVDTNGALAGSISISPEHNTNYSVKCLSDGEEIGSNTCSVSVGNPLYDIISYPSSVGEGQKIKITWASLFMRACRVEGPRGFDYTSSHGVVMTEPFEVGASGSISSATYNLTCRTEFEDFVSKEVEVGKN